MPEQSSPRSGTLDTAGDGSLPHEVWNRLINRLAGINMFLIMGGGFAFGFLADRIDTLEPYAWLGYLAAGFLPIILQTVSTDDHGYDYEITHGERVRFILSLTRWSVTPWGIVAQVLQIGGNFVPYIRYRGALPGRDRHVPDTDFHLPFDGEWTTVNGGITKETSHSWGLVAQRYAYDFLRTDADGNTHKGDGSELTDYYAFGESIRAPADGTVVRTVDHLRDYPDPGSGWTEWRTWQLTGNYVVIEHDSGEYSLLAHLKQDSVTVDPGDRVEQGDIVGQCGNSGHSSEPHLHFQVQDHPNFWISAGLCPRFRDVDIERDDDRADDHEVYANREHATAVPLWAGDRVTPRTRPSPGSSRSDPRTHS